MNIIKQTIFGKLDKTVPVFIFHFLYSLFRNEGKQFIKWVCLEEQTGWTKGGKASVSVTPALPMGGRRGCGGLSLADKCAPPPLFTRELHSNALNIFHIDCEFKTEIKGSL